MWLLSNRSDYNLIHRNFTKFLKELCQIGLTGAERKKLKKMPLNSQISTSRKQGWQDYPVVNVNHFLYKMMDDSELLG